MIVIIDFLLCINMYFKRFGIKVCTYTARMQYDSRDAYICTHIYYILWEHQRMSVLKEKKKQCTKQSTQYTYISYSLTSKHWPLNSTYTHIKARAPYIYIYLNTQYCLHHCPAHLIIKSLWVLSRLVGHTFLPPYTLTQCRTACASMWHIQTVGITTPFIHFFYIHKAKCSCVL